MEKAGFLPVTLPSCVCQNLTESFREFLIKFLRGHLICINCFKSADSFYGFGIHVIHPPFAYSDTLEESPEFTVHDYGQ